MLHRALLPIAVAVAILLGHAAIAAAPIHTCVVTPPFTTFKPPLPLQPAPSGMFWYGAPMLWTQLRADGSAARRDKSWWWHPGFDGRVESHPDLQVAAIERFSNIRIGAPRATNALLPDGWAMLTMLDFPMAGCWDVAATYQGASVIYVVTVN